MGVASSNRTEPTPPPPPFLSPSIERNIPRNTPSQHRKKTKPAMKIMHTYSLRHMGGLHKRSRMVPSPHRTHTRSLTHKHFQMHIHTCMCVDVCVCVLVYVYVCVRICVHTHICVNTHMDRLMKVTSLMVYKHLFRQTRRYARMTYKIYV